MTGEIEKRKYDYELKGRKLAAIGLTDAEYRATLNAFHSHNNDELQRFTALSQARMDARNQTASATTREMYFSEAHNQYSVTRSELHKQLVQQALSGKEPDAYPKLTILAGLPGVGKSKFKEVSGSYDYTVQTDPDAIKHALLEGYDGINLDHMQATHDESLDVAQMILDISLRDHYSVVCESTMRHVPWILQTVGNAKSEGYTTELVFLHKAPVDCFQDAFERSERPVTLPFLLSSLDGYENVATLQRGGVFDSMRIVDMSDNQIREVANDTLPSLIASVQPLRITPKN